MIDFYIKKLFGFCASQQKKIYLILTLLIAGVMFSSLVPPFQSPDEQSHLTRAYLLSKGRIAMETPEGQSTGGRIDTGFNAYMGEYNHIPTNQNSKVTLDVKSAAAEINWSGEERFGSSPGINYYLPFIYLPQTLGLLIGQWADFTVEDSYYLARCLAFLCSISIILFAFSVARVNAFVLAILFMPMMVFQMVSTSQDGFSIALLILSLSLYVSLTSFGANNKYFYIMTLSIFLLVTSRINLLPLLLLPYIAVALTTKSRKQYLISVVATCFAIAWIIYALNTTVDNRVAIGAPTKEIIMYYLQSPLQFLSVLYQTLSDNQISSFYVGSFVGILGWLDTPMGEHVYFSIVFALILIFVTSTCWREIKIEVISRGALIFVATISFFLTFFLLLITWTEHPAKTISGVQGRYLWGPVIVLAYGMTVPFYKLSNIKKLVCAGGIVAIVSVVVFEMPSVLVERYYTNNTYKKKENVEEIFKETVSSLNKIDVPVSEVGGFIDSVSLIDGRVSLTGWGFYSENNKQFFGNIDASTSIKYKTKLRQDVANAYKNDDLIYSGFTLILELKDIDTLSQLCLYTKDPIFGVKQILPGNSDMLYKCANK
ncbi:DUF2142 domain-containing protein [Cellvibrio sp. NN19]|uniref:DUF2142 domain-containing protein n=1 Tax=Cellvibrio chitinivorans TaxID=3102792 RepID=UPI002B4051FB|nr:DUF2142 domain-containing protein [Cellvibrio sp. NN19]